MIPTPRCRRDEAPPLFRAMFCVVPHPFFPAYHRMDGPNQSPLGLFRVSKWAACTLSPQVASLSGVQAWASLVGGTHHAASPPWRAGASLPQGALRAREEARRDALSQDGLRYPG
jgi:hypothetical protein